MLKNTNLCSMPRWIQYKSLLNNLNYTQFIQYSGADDRAILLDVRTEKEFKMGTIEGAIHLNYLSPTLADDMELLDVSNIYYIFCRTGRRSLRVCMLLKNSGFTVYNLENGITNI